MAEEKGNAMKQREVAITDFDLKDFTKAVISFLGEEVSQHVHPSYAIVKITAPGGVPEFSLDVGNLKT